MTAPGLGAGLAVLLAQEAGGATGGSTLTDILGEIGWIGWTRVAALVLLGIPLVVMASRFARRWSTARVNAQVGLIIGNAVFYAGLATVVVTTMTELGFSLAPLLGAAGVVGIALGFASQTSVSNVIAGFFLVGERPFVVDDVVQVGETIGRVLSIDALSVKLRTFDNRFVRIPNETLIKSTVINITRFPIRRIDVRVGVAYSEQPEKVREVLLDIADRNPIALMEPEPLVIFEGFGESSLNFLFAVWATKENFLELKTSIQNDLKSRFDEEGIEIPFPHRTLYVGSETDAFPVRVVQDDAAPPSSEAGDAQP